MNKRFSLVIFLFLSYVQPLNQYLMMCPIALKGKGFTTFFLEPFDKT